MWSNIIEGTLSNEHGQELLGILFLCYRLNMEIFGIAFKTR